MDCLKKKKRPNRNADKMQIRERTRFSKSERTWVNNGHLPYEIQETISYPMAGKGRSAFRRKASWESVVGRRWNIYPGSTEVPRLLPYPTQLEKPKAHFLERVRYQTDRADSMDVMGCTGAARLSTPGCGGPDLHYR